MTEIVKQSAYIDAVDAVLPSLKKREELVREKLEALKRCVAAGVQADWSVWLEWMRAVEKTADTEHAELKAPITRDGKKVDATFRPLRKICEEGKKFCGEQIAALHVAARESAQEAHKAFVSAAAAGDTQAAQTALSAFEAPVQAGGKVQWVWEWEVEDATKVPDALKSVDEKKVAAYLADLGDSTPAIEGIRFKHVPKVSAKGR